MAASKDLFAHRLAGDRRLVLAALMDPHMPAGQLRTHLLLAGRILDPLVTLHLLGVLAGREGSSHLGKTSQGVFAGRALLQNVMTAGENGVQHCLAARVGVGLTAGSVARVFTTIHNSGTGRLALNHFLGFRSLVAHSITIVQKIKGSIFNQTFLPESYPEYL